MSDLGRAARAPIARGVPRVALLVALAAPVLSCGGSGSASTDAPTGPTTPTVATVSVGPAPQPLTVGATAQLTATATSTAGGTVTGYPPTWNSATPGVATVSASGLVTALAPGSSVISATILGVSGKATVTVTATDFNPLSGTALTGTQTFATVNIPEGVTVTATGDLSIVITDSAVIAGNITGDCVDIELVADGPLVLNGNIDNACSTSPTDAGHVRIVGTTVDLTDAHVSTFGSLTITNDTTVTVAAALAGAYARTGSEPGRAHQTAGGGCKLDGFDNIPDHELPTPVNTGTATPGLPGRPTFISCRGDLIITNSKIFGGDGRDGVSAELHAPSPTATGGNGGRAGELRIVSTGNIYFGTNVRFGPGNPGLGGAATAIATDPGGSATAVGGNGGDTGIQGQDGPVIVIAGGTMTAAERPLLWIGTMLPGGRASALAGDGANAAGGLPAQRGGGASATSGDAGSLHGHNIVRANAGTAAVVNFDLETNRNRDASAVGGMGGTGDAQQPDGAKGGYATAIGGRGGSVTSRINNFIPDVTGAAGGAAYVEGGRGGDGFGACTALEAPRPGGSGGAGGNAAGHGGAGGTGSTGTGATGTFNFVGFGNGGNGARGWGPGDAGGAGTNDASGTIQMDGSSLSPGSRGPRCPVNIASAFTVASDPNGHAAFVLFQTIVQLVFGPPSAAARADFRTDANATGDDPITITGSGPWVTINGTVSADGTITAAGTGTVAGYPNVRVTLSGKITDGTFSGTVTAGDETPNTLPGGGITYSVTGPASSP